MSSCKNIIILSEKSSGSSACQNLLAQFADIRHVEKTRHTEHETLYWTKAASILGKPQLKMVDSEVPIEPEKAKAELISLLRNNLEDYEPPDTNEELISAGWNRLCKRYSPIFIEKSPHHLCQWSAIELIVEHMRATNDVDFLLVGLVRNPMDTIYSQYKRWKSPPEKVEQQWRVAYQNLLRLQDIVGKKLVIVRYEDIVSSLKHLEAVFDFCGVTANTADEKYLHKKSINKWKTDRLFGHLLSDQTIELAKKYGYQQSELINKPNPLSGIIFKTTHLAYLSVKPIRKIAQRMRNRIKSYVANKRSASLGRYSSARGNGR